MTLFEKLLAKNSSETHYSKRSVLLKKWELLEVIQRCPKRCSTIPYIRENRINPVDSVPLATLRVSKFRDIRKGWLCKISRRISDALLIVREIANLQNFLQNKERNVRYNLQKILQSHFFLMPRIETQDCQGYGVKRIKSNFADKGNNGTRFGTSLYTSNSPQFFNKTNLVNPKNLDH